jgi:hypothetical protein
VPLGVLALRKTPSRALIGPVYVLMPKYERAATLPQTPPPSGVGPWQPA